MTCAKPKTIASKRTIVKLSGLTLSPRLQARRTGQLPVDLLSIGPGLTTDFVHLPFLFLFSFRPLFWKEALKHPRCLSQPCPIRLLKLGDLRHPTRRGIYPTHVPALVHRAQFHMGPARDNPRRPPPVNLELRALSASFHMQFAAEYTA